MAKVLFWLKKVDTSWAPVGENRDAYVLRREITWGLAQRNMLLILDIISVTKVTGGGITLIPCCCFKTQGVNMKSGTS